MTTVSVVVGVVIGVPSIIERGAGKEEDELELFFFVMFNDRAKFQSCFMLYLSSHVCILLYPVHGSIDHTFEANLQAYS